MQISIPEMQIGMYSLFFSQEVLIEEVLLDLWDDASDGFSGCR
jgi:hypothetical protein